LHRANEEGTGCPLFYCLMGMEVLMQLKDAIEAELENFFSGTQFFVVDVKVLPGYKIYIFADGTENITIEKCIATSRHLEAFLESGGLVPEHYLLEVSSPGMDQPFKVLPQYYKAIGRDMEVVLADGRKLEGILREVSETGIVLEEQIIKKGKVIESIIHELPFDQIKTTKKSIKF
jgi:ribosome maturation factor RimP